MSNAQEPHEPSQQDARQEHGAVVAIPKLMAREHEALHEQLAAAISAGGRTGAAARNVEARLAPHFEEENRFALPPLGVLPQLAREGASEEMRPAIAMAQHVEQNFDRFVAEHSGITQALEELESAAEAEGNAEALRFVAELRAHAQEEEELFYPTTILIGRYLQRELGGR
jgi:hypothetical protein